MPPLDDRAGQRVRMAEQRGRLVHAPLRHQTPDTGAADDKFLVADRIDLFGAKAIPLSQHPQRREVPAALVSEEEIGADPDFRHVQPFDQHRAHERVRIPARQLAGEANHGDAVDPRLAERGNPLIFCHQERRRLVGAYHLRRMRIERHRHGDAAMLDGAALHALDDLEVSAVQAVEVAERQHRMHEPGRPRIVGKMQDLHQATTRPPGRRTKGHHTPVRRLEAGARWSRHVPDRATCGSCRRGPAQCARSPRAPRRR